MLKPPFRPVDKRRMRSVASITLLVLLGTAGCADASHLMPAMRVALHASRDAAAATGPPHQRPGPARRPDGAVDMSGVLRAAVRLPQDVARLHDVIVTALVTITILGLANIALMLAVLERLSRVTHGAEQSALQPAALAPFPSTDAPPPIAAHAEDALSVPEASIIKLIAAGESTARVCACGAAIAARSRSGRCRACAHAAVVRAKRASAGTADIPVHA